ncbi:MAG: hypothetical protein KIS76_06150 [Pyrinomonadaceae bacterium]|nr:hypothetical protein [Pyrinomonadaceae bacterium]
MRLNWTAGRLPSLRHWSADSMPAMSATREQTFDPKKPSFSVDLLAAAGGDAGWQPALRHCRSLRRCGRRRRLAACAPALQISSPLQAGSLRSGNADLFAAAGWQPALSGEQSYLLRIFSIFLPFASSSTSLSR